MSEVGAITRRGTMQRFLPATAGGAAAPAAPAQTTTTETIARADTLMTTGQPTGGAPTFAQCNDFNPFHPGLDLRSSIAFVLEPLFFDSVLPDRMLPWLAERFEYNADNTAITVHPRKGFAYWKGWPNEADPYINPTFRHNTGNPMLLGLQTI